MNKYLFSTSWKLLASGKDKDGDWLMGHISGMDFYPNYDAEMGMEDFGIWQPDNKEEKKQEYVLPENNKLQEPKCKHLKKRKSHALGKSFWYCPDCKEEVDGDK